MKTEQPDLGMWAGGAGMLGEPSWVGGGSRRVKPEALPGSEPGCGAFGSVCGMACVCS